MPDKSFVCPDGGVGAVIPANCGRVATHQPFANAGERTWLLTHVRMHLTPAPVPVAVATST